MIDLKDGAIFVADSHYQKGVREEFYDFLTLLEIGKIETTQLILMGDMFDLLVGSIRYTLLQNQQPIQLLNQLSKKMEIIYLEGNHDFNLKDIFKEIKIIPISSQPLIASYHDKKIALAHGDNFGTLGYRLYVGLIRNRYFLRLLNLIDHIAGQKISKTILKSQKEKKLCKKLNNFQNKAKQKLKFYDITVNKFDLICEGHYHMDEDYLIDGVKYIFFSSYACDGDYFKLSYSQEVVFNQLKG